MISPPPTSIRLSIPMPHTIDISMDRFKASGGTHSSGSSFKGWPRVRSPAALRRVFPVFPMIERCSPRLHPTFSIFYITRAPIILWP